MTCCMSSALHGSLFIMCCIAQIAVWSNPLHLSLLCKYGSNSLIISPTVGKIARAIEMPPHSAYCEVSIIR